MSGTTTTDELDSFFAKKAAKKAKKPIAQDIDSLAKKLEKVVRHQMLIDERLEEERIQNQRQQVLDYPEAEEDSEWITVDADSEIDLKRTGLKELDIEAIEENDVAVTNEKVEKVKTWSIPVNVQPTVETQPAEPVPKVPQRYVPPSVKQAQRAAPDSRPNVQDAEEFPSLSAADDLSKKEAEKKKLKAQQAKEFDERERQLQAKRDADRCANQEKAPVVETNSAVLKTDEKRMQFKVTPSQSEVTDAVEQKKYVSPHLRNKHI